MRIYHGSLSVVKQPEIRVSSRLLDYGSGFYTTTSFEQAERWVRRHMKESAVNAGNPKGFVNIYQFDERAMVTLNTITFTEPSEEWLDFVMLNRTSPTFKHYYDIVYGPVANDRVYAAFALYEGKVLSKESLISELKTYRLVDQYLFHTQRSLESISFIEAKEVM